MTNQRKGRYGPKAKDGHIFVCCACGKTSRELYGGPTADRAWDESCMLNAVEANERDLLRDSDGRVREITGKVTKP